MIKLTGRPHVRSSRMYDVGGKLLRGIKSMHINSPACIKVKLGECLFQN